MRTAITRQVSDALGHCLLTHLERRRIDVGLARRQHAAYEMLLAELGCRVVSLPAQPGMPDSVFVEDAAVVVDELAILTRSGAPARRAENATVAAALAPHRELRSIEPPATLDGGDVLRAGREIWVGRSERSNQQGLEQLRRLLAPLGYRVAGLAVDGCLHLKSAVTEVADGTLLINPALVDTGPLAGYRLLEVDPAEPWAGNALRIGSTVVVAAHHPRTRRRLEETGLEIREVDADELAKAEGGLTCCSLILE